MLLSTICSVCFLSVILANPEVRNPLAPPDRWSFEDIRKVTAASKQQRDVESIEKNNGCCGRPAASTATANSGTSRAGAYYLQQGCTCPPNYSLIGYKNGLNATQHWRCVQYKPNPKIPCNTSCDTASHTGFCQSNSAIDLPHCRVPNCIFDDKDIYGDGNEDLSLNWAPDGFFVLSIVPLDLESPCGGSNIGPFSYGFNPCYEPPGICIDGQPKCIRRIPYYFFNC